MKGRKAIPSKILELRGGSSHTHRAPRKEAVAPSKIPTCPAHLCKQSKIEWRRVSKLLDSIGLLTELDRSILAEYCEAYGKWVTLKGELAMINKIDIDNGSILKDAPRRVEQYRTESTRWQKAMKENRKGVVYKKKTVSHYLALIFDWNVNRQRNLRRLKTQSSGRSGTQKIGCLRQVR